MFNLKNLKSNRMLIFFSILYDRIRLFFRIKKADNPSSKISSYIYKDGFHVIENFLTKDQCKELIDEFNKNLSFTKKYDNDKRIFGMHHISDISRKLIIDSPLVKSVCSVYLGKNFINQTLMFGNIKHSADSNEGSGGGLHRDSFATQLKVLIYLTDVYDKNGPFQYLKKSNSVWYLFKSILRFGKKTRFDSENLDTNKIFEKNKLESFHGKAGTLLFVDTRGLHKGKRLYEGERYAATTYYVSKIYYNPDSPISQFDQETKDSSYISFN